MSTKTVRNIREPLKKPRPLKSTPSSDQIKLHIQDPKDAVIQKSRTDILADLEILNISISNCNFDEVTVADISRMCAILKKRGEELDSTNKEALDRYFCTLRNASREDRLDLVSRLKLLEVIEMRAMHWKMNENLTNYFNQKFLEYEQQGADRMTISPNIQTQNITANGIPLAPGEILRSSGKFSKPTKITGKNYFKDEIIIRNSDSGKVMGIKGRRVHMIEELSDTVISFQRVNPGARDRLVQITGPHEEAIGHAKILVEDTIRRNASPVRENADLLDLDLDNKNISEYSNPYLPMDNQHFVKKQQLTHSYSMGDTSLREYTIPLYIGQDIIKLSSTKADLLKTAKLVLTEYFAGQTELLEKHENFSSNIQSPDSIQKFELKKQTSFKENLPNSITSSTFRRDSISPFSSSEDDVSKEEGNYVPGRTKEVKNFLIHSSVSNPGNQVSADGILGNSNKYSRSYSVPNDFSSVPSFLETSPSSIEEIPPSLVSMDAAPIPPPSYKKHSYSREFLLKCASSPFSHNQPEDYVHIHQQFPEIICQSPVMFDPTKYRDEVKFEESTSSAIR